MLQICLVFWKSETKYAYKRYAYKKTCSSIVSAPQIRLAPVISTDQIRRLNG